MFSDYVELLASLQAMDAASSESVDAALRPLLRAICSGDPAAVSALMEEEEGGGVTLLMRRLRRGVTPVHVAAALGRVPVLEVLVARGGLQLAEEEDEGKRTAVEVATGGARPFLKQVWDGV